MTLRVLGEIFTNKIFKTIPSELTLNQINHIVNVMTEDCKLSYLKEYIGYFNDTCNLGRTVADTKNINLDKEIYLEIAGINYGSTKITYGEFIEYCGKTYIIDEYNKRMIECRDDRMLRYQYSNCNLPSQ